MATYLYDPLTWDPATWIPKALKYSSPHQAAVILIAQGFPLPASSLTFAYEAQIKSGAPVIVDMGQWSVEAWKEWQVMATAWHRTGQWIMAVPWDRWDQWAAIAGVSASRPHPETWVTKEDSHA